MSGRTVAAIVSPSITFSLFWRSLCRALDDVLGEGDRVWLTINGGDAYAKTFIEQEIAKWQRKVSYPIEVTWSWSVLHGPEVSKILRIAPGKVLLLLEDDCFMGDRPDISGCFQAVERGHVQVVTSQHGVPEPVAGDGGRRVFGLLGCGYLAEYDVCRPGKGPQADGLRLRGPRVPSGGGDSGSRLDSAAGDRVRPGPLARDSDARRGDAIRLRSAVSGDVLSMLPDGRSYAAVGRFRVSAVGPCGAGKLPSGSQVGRGSVGGCRADWGLYVGRSRLAYDEGRDRSENVRPGKATGRMDQGE
jgi:hypothetical protein